MTSRVATILLFGIALATPTWSAADPLAATSGRIVLSSPGLIPNPYFQIDGAQFHFENFMTIDGLAGAADWEFACSSAASGDIPMGRCRGGDVVNLSFSVAGELGTGAGTIDGRQYDALTYRGALSAAAVPVIFQPLDEEQFAFVDVSTSFVFSGLLRVFDGDREIFAHALKGQGTATMSYENEGERVGGRPVFLPRGDGEDGPGYAFAPVPEPSTLLLTTAPLIASLRFRRRKS